MIAGPVEGSGTHDVENPARPGDVVGRVTQSSPQDIETAMAAAEQGFQAWSAVPVEERAQCVRRVADLYEAHGPEIFALAAREAGKTLLDGVGEVREAADFARYYANEAVRLDGHGAPRGVIACISPWNFPLAIFSGQILGGAGGGERGHRQARRADPADRRQSGGADA